MSGKSTKKTEEKKRDSYSFSIRKTDNPVIKQFIQTQTNYSESIRYLIIKFCRENGVQDISYKLNELMYFPDVLEMNNNINNASISEEKNSESNVIVHEEIQQDYKEEMNTESFTEKGNKEESKIVDNDDDIPECYK